MTSFVESARRQLTELLSVKLLGPYGSDNVKRIARVFMAISEPMDLLSVLYRNLLDTHRALNSHTTGQGSVAKPYNLPIRLRFHHEAPFADYEVRLVSNSGACGCRSLYVARAWCHRGRQGRGSI